MIWASCLTVWTPPRAALRQAAQQADLILTCGGGVSGAKKTTSSRAVQAEGRLNLWQMAIKPGKPLAFGAVRRESGRWKPGSSACPATRSPATSTFQLLVRPVLPAPDGRCLSLAPRAYTLRADFDWPRPDKPARIPARPHQRARVGWSCTPNQGSGVLTSVVWGDGLVDLTSGQVVQSGDLVRFLPLRELS